MTTTLDTDLWLYGSQARGDADDESDTDVLIVSDDPAAAGRYVGRFHDATISVYSWAEAETMAAYGSLFLDHIKRDGRRLASEGSGARRFDRLIADLHPYRRAMTDLRSFSAAIADSRESLDEGGWPDYELEVAATVMRHAAVLGAYCAGRPDYGRDSGFATVGEVLGYPRSVVGSLQNAYRRYRRDARKHPDLATCNAEAPAVLDLADNLVADLEEVITRYAKARQTPPSDPRRQ